jgi:hypothetical protein
MDVKGSCGHGLGFGPSSELIAFSALNGTTFAPAMPSFSSFSPDRVAKFLLVEGQVPKAMIGRRLSREEAKRLLAKCE